MISGSWVRERRFTVPRLLPRRLRSLHTLALVLALLAIGWLGWLWYRGSSFVRVQHVTVTGLSGPDVPQIREALSSAALEMTTLNVSIAKLETAVSRYGYVERLTVTGAGAHGLVIHVVEQVPVALVQSGGQSQIVDADGYLLPSTAAHGTLPTVPLKNPPDEQSVTAPGARAAIAVLAAAPYALLAHVTYATSSNAHGVIVQLRSGPQIYFGPSVELARKWTAAVAVLQNKDSAGAAYIDVSDPMRPAAGVAVSASQATALGLASSTAADSPAAGSSGG
ncbi:MAG TPA: cell division protein FtsQ/DivIB [Solirubrobacteraceae bacterium]|jgi:cell division protein FtsQ|nr:cell division protein FtsQ/DivIB [Solirubrobacteraceae bacterium]